MKAIKSIALLAFAAPVLASRGLQQAASAPAPAATPFLAGATAAAASPQTVVAPAPAAAITDADILNFALNLEYLEASFYHCALTGQPLATSVTGGGPTPIGCQQAQNLSANQTTLLQSLDRDETNHVTFLRNALGSAAVALPQLDVGPAFAAAANAALGQTLSPAFSPYTDGLFLLHGAFIFEDVGVSAYKGAAPLINNKAYLEAAAGILAIEGYHAGAVRSALINNASFVTPYGVNVSTIVDSIAAARSMLSGFTSPTVGDFNSFDDLGITYAPSQSTPLLLADGDFFSVAYSRTPQQVLNIVYLSSTGQPGGFFPDGLNGNIK